MQMRPGRIATITAQPDLLARRNNLAHPRIDAREMGQIDFMLLIIDQEAYRHAFAIRPPLPRLEDLTDHGCANGRTHRRDDVDTLMRERCTLLAVRVRDARRS